MFLKAQQELFLIILIEASLKTFKMLMCSVPLGEDRTMVWGLLGNNTTPPLHMSCHILHPLKCSECCLSSSWIAAWWWVLPASSWGTGLCVQVSVKTLTHPSGSGHYWIWSRQGLSLYLKGNADSSPTWAAQMFLCFRIWCLCCWVLTPTSIKLLVLEATRLQRWEL